jgi:hypothetical protein
VIEIIDCFLNNSDVIVSWVSHIPTFAVFSVLFNNNDPAEEDTKSDV